MHNPLKASADQFLRVSGQTLLIMGVAFAIIDFAVLYAVAEREKVLFIPRGIGLLQDFGLFSTVAGNAILIYLARRYYDAMCSARTSKAVMDVDQVDESFSKLTSMIKMDDKDGHRIYYYLLLIGALMWMSNTGIHLFGNPEMHWAHKVFDSTDHPLSFVVSRLHNIVTWIIVYPFVVYVLIVCSWQLRHLFQFAVRKNAFKYDLLNPDQRGGFLFAEKSVAVFNVIIAIFYVQLMMHIETFTRMNLEHYLGITIATLLLVFGNRIFLGNVYATIDTAKEEALNAIKDDVYRKDALSFEILKYCYERRINRYSFLNVLTKLVAVAVSAGIKLLPVITQALNRV